MDTDVYETDDRSLRAALAALDPFRGASAPQVHPVTSDRARTLLEAIMSTPLVDDHAEPSPTGHDHTGTTLPSRSVTSSRFSGRRRWYVVTGVGVAAAAALAFIVSSGGSPAVSATQLGLTPSDPLTSICLAFEPSQLEAVEIAFGGTVTEITGDQVTGSTIRLEVDRWFRGDQTDVVDVTVPAGFTAALDGVDFVVGTRYLVTAVDGVVTSCGSSGVASPELEQIFTEVFG